MTDLNSTQRQHAGSEHRQGEIAGSGYQVHLCNETENADWDKFLFLTPGGHHVQTSLWGQVQAQYGWRAVRVVVKREGHIVGGVQVLMRSISPIGTIGFAIKGPVFAIHDHVLIKIVMDELFHLIKNYRIRYLSLQPPNNGNMIARQLPEFGFRQSPFNLVLPATVLIDLSKSLDEILGQMNSKTRYNIRLSQRKGITIREGTSSDIATFHGLLVATSKRQHFVIDSETYFSSLWNIFSPHGYIKLLVAEYEGDVVSAFLEIPFGETVVYKRGAWSGLQGNRHPNEALHWAAITWAKSQGYRYYDFDGIHPGAAQAMVQGETLPAEAVKTVASFKLGFGGEVVLLPVYDYIYNPLLRWSYNAVFPRIRDSALINKALQHLRSRTKNTGK